MSKDKFRIKIIDDDFAKDNNFPSKYIGLEGLIIGWSSSMYKTDGSKVPIIQLDDGRILCNDKLWWIRIS